MPLTATVAARPEVLYLTHRAPYPPDKGDRIRTFHLLKWLSKRAAVHLACLADEELEASTLAILKRLCARVAVVPLVGRWRWARAAASLALGRTATEGAFQSAELRAVVSRWATETRFHAALASASSLVPYLRLETLRGVPVVVDLVDVDSQKWLDYARASRGPWSWLYQVEGRRLRRLEAALADWARGVALVSQEEARLFTQFCPWEGARVITNGVDFATFRLLPRWSEAGCVFVGALDYRPNVDAVQWFCEEVWPGVRRRVPEATLALVGRSPAPAVRRLGKLAGVSVVGPVADVRPHLSRAAVVVAPLRIARGIQNKVLEALAMGKAVVVSPQALEGLRAEPGVHLLVTATPAEWKDAVVRLLGDEATRRRLGEAGRRFVEEHHHWEHCLQPFGSLLELPPPEGEREPAARDVAGGGWARSCDGLA